MTNSIPLTADSPSIGSAFGAPQWGIFTQQGAPLLVVDSVASIEYSRDYHISDYPQEQGAFESYNKVQLPFQAKIGFLINQSRVQFLQNIEAAVASLDLVVVATPEISYSSANLTHYGYRRESSGGVTLIRVEVWCEEVRISATATAAAGTPTTPAPVSPNSDTQSLNGATPAANGQVQGSPTTQSGGGASGGGTGQATGGTSSTATGTVIEINQYHGVELTPPT